MCVWQSWVEIKHYSVAYFDHITALQVLKCRTLVKGGACTCCVYVVSLPTAYELHPQQKFCATVLRTQ